MNTLFRDLFEHLILLLNARIFNKVGKKKRASYTDSANSSYFSPYDSRTFLLR